MRKRNDLNDTGTRERLENWGDWQKIIELIGPSAVPSPQPMFREILRGYREEGYLGRVVKPVDVSDAEYIERVVCQLKSEQHVSAIKRYFIHHQNVITCAQKARMSRRQFENWLNTAVAKIDTIIEMEEKALTVSRIELSIVR